MTEEVFRCPYCAEVFDSDRGLTVHIVEEHEKSRKKSSHGKTKHGRRKKFSIVDSWKEENRVLE